MFQVLLTLHWDTFPNIYFRGEENAMDWLKIAQFSVPLCACPWTSLFKDGSPNLLVECLVTLLLSENELTCVGLLTLKSFCGLLLLLSLFIFKNYFNWWVQLWWWFTFTNGTIAPPEPLFLLVVFLPTQTILLDRHHAETANLETLGCRRWSTDYEHFRRTAKRASVEAASRGKADAWFLF